MDLSPGDLSLSSPWMNSAGSLGYAPARWAWPEPPGAFVTNPISRSRRTPAEDRGLLPYPGGFMLHTGWPNPGFRRVLQNCGPRWAAARLPVWVHLLAEDPLETGRMVRALESVEGVSAVELGLPPGGTSDDQLGLVSAALGELPLVVCVPLDALEEPWVARLPASGVAALVISAPRGSLPAPSGRIASGRLYGPGLLPLVFAALRRLRSLDLPVIPGCGIYNPADGAALLKAGALAVQLDAVLWSVLV